jgi:hypothetical protein
VLKIFKEHPVFYTCLIPVSAEVRISDRNRAFSSSFLVASVDGYKSRSDPARLYADILFVYAG